jgi:hypothetical protein
MNRLSSFVIRSLRFVRCRLDGLLRHPHPAVNKLNMEGIHFAYQVRGEEEGPGGVDVKHIREAMKQMSAKESSVSR